MDDPADWLPSVTIAAFLVTRMESRVPLTDVQVRRIDRSFAHMDVDGNGYLERSDLQALGSRLILGFGEGPGSVKGRDVLDSFDGIWDMLIKEMDTDRDGRLSPQEYRQGMDRTFIDGPHYDRVFQPAVEAAMRLCDTDGDGVLSREEFARFHAAFGHGAADSRVAFDALDRDGGGTLDVDELVLAFREFYTGSDDQAPGAKLFGLL